MRMERYEGSYTAGGICWGKDIAVLQNVKLSAGPSDSSLKSRVASGWTPGVPTNQVCPLAPEISGKVIMENHGSILTRCSNVGKTEMKHQVFWDPTGAVGLGRGETVHHMHN